MIPSPPMAFREIVGHGRIVSLLARSLAEGSVPPSLIFAGPEGVGKRRIAEAFAQALNCRAPVSGAELPGCGICATCTRISRGVFPDVRLVAPGENGSIRIDQIRDAIGQVGYRPFEGRRRVTIIDNAETWKPAILPRREPSSHSCCTQRVRGATRAPALNARKISSKAVDPLRWSASIWARAFRRCRLSLATWACSPAAQTCDYWRTSICD